MKNIIITIIGTALFLGAGILLINVGDQNVEADFSVLSASALAASEDSFDFGTIRMNDGDVTHRFEVTNKGTETVVIGKVYTSCMCTAAYIEDAAGERYGKFGMPGHGLSPRMDITVNPGESAIVEAIFDPAAHGPSGVGLAQRSVYLETNSQTSPRMELTFQAMVTR